MVKRHTRPFQIAVRRTRGGSDSGKMDSDESEDDEDDDAVPRSSLLAQHLIATMGAPDAQSDEEEDKTPALTADPPTVSAPTASSSADDDARSAAILPTADDALEASSGLQEGFLRVQGPEFDASKGFKPPPLTAADLLPVVDDSQGSRGGSRRMNTASVATAADQRYHEETHFGLAPNAVRLSGSVCKETDDERGRRVRYGAHQMLKADPWSQCNPNIPKHSGQRSKH